MCLAVPGRIREIVGDGTSAHLQNRLRRNHARSPPRLPARSPGRRLCPGTRRVRHQPHRSRGSPDRTLELLREAGLVIEQEAGVSRPSLPGHAVKYLDEYRDAGLVRQTRREIARTVTRPWVVMEICGGQTHTIMRYGLDTLLPPSLEIVHGPGCPVCVTALETVDKAIDIASRPDVDLRLLRRHAAGPRLAMPTCSRVRARGGDVRIVYSPLEALKLAAQIPRSKVVFFAIGFETTAPAHALAVTRRSAPAPTISPSWSRTSACRRRFAACFRPPATGCRDSSPPATCAR